MRLQLNHSSYEYDKHPEVCPLCDSRIEPNQICGNVINAGSTEHKVLQIVFSCPKKYCGQAFIGSYTREPGFSPYNKTFYLTGLAPYKHRTLNFPIEIKELSSNFAEIYSQAFSAEKYGLDQIAGVGYRKALEFLIKDFCISKHPDKETQIKETYLYTCINTYLSDSNIKECAKRATWLGNDETHYVRKWEDKDITNLKNMIQLTVAWISHSLLTEKYISGMKPAENE